MCCNLAYMGPVSSGYISWYTGGELGLEIIYFSLHLFYGSLVSSSIVIALLVLVFIYLSTESFSLVIFNLIVYIITKINRCTVVYLFTINENDGFGS